MDSYQTVVTYFYSVVFDHCNDQMSTNVVFFESSMTIHFPQHNHVLGRPLNSHGQIFICISSLLEVLSPQ